MTDTTVLSRKRSKLGLAMGTVCASISSLLLLPTSVLAIDSKVTENKTSSISTNAQPQEVKLKREVRALPGKLEGNPVVYSNSPEIVVNEGILLSTLSGTGKKDARAHLDFPLSGTFDVFYHHIADGRKSSDQRDLTIALLVHNPGTKTVELSIEYLLSYLSQPDAPFVGLPAIVEQKRPETFAGPGDRVTSELLDGKKSSSGDNLEKYKIAPGRTVIVSELPIPVTGLVPPLNGRTFMGRLKSTGPVRVAIVSRFASEEERAASRDDRVEIYTDRIKNASLVTPREVAPTPPDSKGGIRYGRVSGIVKGSVWSARIHDGNFPFLVTPPAGYPISYVISSLRGGTFGTGKPQSASMLKRYDDTAYESHGNYGVLYKLTMDLNNVSDRKAKISLALESPLKSDLCDGKVSFLEPAGKEVYFRGTIKSTVSKESPCSATSPVDKGSKANKLGSTGDVKFTHCVLHRGEAGSPFRVVELSPHSTRSVAIELYYPADCTPPQIVTIDSKYD